MAQHNDDEDWCVDSHARKGRKSIRNSTCAAFLQINLQLDACDPDQFCKLTSHQHYRECAKNGLFIAEQIFFIIETARLTSLLL